MRIGALIPVRLSSERLPGKALLPIAGRPMIEHLLDRVCASRHLAPDRVVVCTTDDRADDALEPVVAAAGARLFRGSRDDIIDRFHRAVEEHGFDAVIQADGDDPCTDTGYMDRCMDDLLEDESLDIVIAEGLPLGLASKAFRTSALRTVWERHATERNDTGFIYYFTRSGLCSVGTVRVVSPEHEHAGARLTLDYPEDLAFFRALFDELYGDGEIFGIDEIVGLLRRRPELVEINSFLTEGYWERTRDLVRLEFHDGGALRRVEA
jgi:spore coat polysaccharide biosynthesis protein SpsF (cytidylyltransferase family)